MAKFKVYEVQEETILRQWMYEVEAEDAEEALQLVHDGDGGDVIDCGETGDGDYGESGWAVGAPDADENEDCFAEAQDDMTANL